MIVCASLVYDGDGDDDDDCELLQSDLEYLLFWCILFWKFEILNDLISWMKCLM